MKSKEIDALFISKPKNLLYVSSIAACSILLTHDFCTVFTNEIDYDKINAGVFDVEISKKNGITDYINKSNPKKIGIENINVNSYRKLKENIKSDMIVSDIVKNVRMIKSDYEINLLTKSAEIAKKGIDRAYEVVKPGISEIAAAAKIEYEIRKNGSESPPFEHGMLLASGKNSAEIHGFPSQKKIKSHELVVVDLGAKYKKYQSDMTRTITVGELKRNSEEANAYEFIKNLQTEIIDKIEIGMKSSDIHNFAEEKIKKLGYKFYHGIGHGVGLEVQELPRINGKSEEILSENMVFTIEPGIYVPGKFGVRFEDTVLLTKKGCRVLTC